MTKRQQERARHAAITATAELSQFDSGTPAAPIDAEERCAALARWRGEEEPDADKNGKDDASCS
jgi:hypothetical protein